MNLQELEDLYIRSLDVPLRTEEKELMERELQRDPGLAKVLEQHSTIRMLIRAKETATFGPYFAAKVIHKIQNTGHVIDQQIFSFFKKFQLAAVGVIMALIVLNIIFAEQPSIPSILGLETTVTTEEEIFSFDFLETLNDSL